MLRAEVLTFGNPNAVLAAFQRSLAARLKVAMLLAAEKLHELADPLVPRDTEALAETGRAYTVGSGLDVQGVVGYGGIDFPPKTEFSIKENAIVTRDPQTYAVYVHEIPQVHIPGQADFLREPTLTKTDEIRQAFNLPF